MLLPFSHTSPLFFVRPLANLWWIQQRLQGMIRSLSGRRWRLLGVSPERQWGALGTWPKKRRFSRDCCDTSEQEKNHG